MQSRAEQQFLPPLLLFALLGYWLTSPPLRKLNCASSLETGDEDPAKVYFLLFPQRLTLLAIFVSTFLFSLTWQFNQFMMLLQALVLFILDSLDMLPAVKVSAARLPLRGAHPPVAPSQAAKETDTEGDKGEPVDLCHRAVVT